MRRIIFTVQVGDVAIFEADVLALKFAEALFGADAAITWAMGKTFVDVKKAIPALGDYRLFPALGKIRAKQALYVNVGSLIGFNYEEIRKFAARALGILADEAPSTRHLAMTVQGVGYGLDEAEALRSQLAGCLDALESGHYPSALERITIVELVRARALRLQAILNDAMPGNTVTLPGITETLTYPRAIERSPLISDVGRASASKPHIFVAMPFDAALDDVFHYGIQAPVNAAGYLCERADLTAFTGDILARIKTRIETAVLVIAELSGANPNVFLEVGFAWGKERPTILLVQDTQKLPFDVRGQRCLVYKRIRDLEEALTKELQGLKQESA